MKKFLLLSILILSFISFGQTAQDYYEKGNTYKEDSQFTNAVIMYTRAIYINPYNPDYYNKRAWSYFSLADYTNALKDFDSELELKPRQNNENAIVGRVRVNMELGNYDSVIVDLDYLIAYHNNTFSSKVGVYHLQRGKALLYLGKKEQACEDFRESRSRKMADAQPFIDKFCNKP